jgi:hypothetical protein
VIKEGVEKLREREREREREGERERKREHGGRLLETQEYCLQRSLGLFKLFATE